MNMNLAASIVLKLQLFSNDEIAAFNKAVQWGGKIHPENLAYAPALKARIIGETGEPYDLTATQTASASEVLRRVNEGIFQ